MPATGRLGLVALVVLMHVALLWLLAMNRVRVEMPKIWRGGVPVYVQPVPRAREQAVPVSPPATVVPERARGAMPGSTSRRAVEPKPRGTGTLEAAPPAPPAKLDEPPPIRPGEFPLRLDADALREATRASRSDLARLLEADEARWNAGALRGESERLAAAIDDAAIPGCLRPDAMKHAPIRLGGLLDLPLLAHAALTGKCR